MKLLLMNSACWALTVAISGSVIISSATAHNILELHGSGTTNPSKCFWNIMEELTEQAGTAVRMSYRAVGSTTGIEEFRVGIVNASAQMHLMFGSGDIPIPKDIFDEINQGATNGKFVHLPVLAGAVSFFHSVPDMPPLNLTACVLGQIYNQKLIFWGDEPIVDLNPDLSEMAKKTKIRVAVRSEGSSSTSSITEVSFLSCICLLELTITWSEFEGFREHAKSLDVEHRSKSSLCLSSSVFSHILRRTFHIFNGTRSQYLHSACDDESQQLPLELVGDQPSWPDSPANNPDLMVACSGSAGMAQCVEDVPGTIAYLEAGHGIASGLTEVRLHNRDAAVGTTVFRNSQESSIQAAVGVDVFPSSPDEDFSGVSFINRGGASTWPIVLITYVYVRKDLSFLDPLEQALLVAFLRALQMPDYIQRCADEYGFTLLDIEEIQQFTETGINMVDSSIGDKNMTKFAFEGKVSLPVAGAGEYVFSQKRRQIADIELQELMEQFAVVQAQLDEMLGTSSESLSVREEGFFGDTEESQLKAALALGSISFIFWILWIAAYIQRYLKSSSHAPVVAGRVDA